MTTRTEPRLVLCGEASSDPGAGSVVRIPRGVAKTSLQFSPSSLRPPYGRSLTDPWIDLLTIAGFVYAADGAVSRPERRGMDLHGADWPRSIEMVIPVLEPDRWSPTQVTDALSELLLSITGDKFLFRFVSVGKRDSVLMGLFTPDTAGLGPPPRVVLFSGGLDSTSRIVESTADRDRRTVAVTLTGRRRLDGHRDTLFTRLTAGGNENILRDVVLRCERHGCDAELTSRSRPFLLYALGAATAWALDSDHFEVPENAIVAVNLPLAGDVTLNRASRTAHPETRWLVPAFVERVTGTRIRAENPFEELTREEVIQRLDTAGRLDLVDFTVSCSSANPGKRGEPEKVSSAPERESAPMARPPEAGSPPDAATTTTHCGRCTQCVDRRVAILQGGWERFDDSRHYAVDPIEGCGQSAGAAGTLQDYVVSAAEWGRSESYREFTTASSRRGMQLADAVRCSARLWDASQDDAGHRLWQLHRRHGQRIAALYLRLHERDWIRALRGELNQDSLVAVVAGQITKSLTASTDSSLTEGAPAARTYRGTLGRWNTVVLDDYGVELLKGDLRPGELMVDARDPGVRLWRGVDWEETERGRGGLHHFLAAILHAHPNDAVDRIRQHIPNKPAIPSVDKSFRELRGVFDSKGPPLKESLHRSGEAEAYCYRFAPTGWVTVLVTPKKASS